MNRQPLNFCARSHRRSGFSLVEVMMAMTLLSIILLSMARMSLVVSTRGRANDVVAKRNAVLLQESNKFGAMSYDSLGTISTANKSFKSGDFSYTRRLTITTSGVNRTVKIAVVPTLDPTKVDSVFVYRSKPSGSPLCVGC